MSRPVPVPDDESGPFWEATATGVLALARCADCQTSTHPPTPVCPACRSTEPAWTFHPVAPHGVVRSWTVLRQAFLPGFADDLPVVLVDVALDGPDDLRIIGRLLDGPDAPVHLGARVDVARAAIADAGLRVEDVDGFTASSLLPTSGDHAVVDGVTTVSPNWLAASLGVDPSYVTGFQGYGQLPGSVALAVNALVSGAANHVLLLSGRAGERRRDAAVAVACHSSPRYGGGVVHTNQRQT